MLFAAPVMGAPQDELSTTWRDVMNREVEVGRTNTSSEDEVWTATITPLAPALPAPPDLVLDPVKQDKVAPKASVSFRVLLGPRTSLPPGADVRYLITIERARGTSEKTVEQTIVHVRPVLRLPAMDDGKAYVLQASRWFPFATPWTIAKPIVLGAVPDPRHIGLTAGSRMPLGVVTATSPTGIDHSAVVSWRRGTQTAAQIPLDLDFPASSAAKMTGTLTFPDGQRRSVTVQTVDPIIYPFLLICIGVVIAFAVKRYLTRQRAALVLRASLTDTDARLRLADQEFQRLAATHGFRGFDVLPAWQQFRAQTETDLGAIALRGGALDDSNAAFTALNTIVDGTRTLPARWLAFATTLQELDALRDGIANLVPPAAAATSRPAIETSLDTLLRGTALTSLDGLTQKIADVNQAMTTARAWRAAWDRSAHLARASSNAVALTSIQSAQLQLWLGSDATTLAAVKQLLDAAVAAIVAAGGAQAARRESVVPPEPLTAPALDVTATPEARQVQRQDRLAFVIALVLAVLTGLNAEYFGKPFGSLADYSRVLAWALSASIAVDIGSLALDRVKSMLSVPARVVTRA